MKTYQELSSIAVASNSDVHNYFEHNLPSTSTAVLDGLDFDYSSFSSNESQLSTSLEENVASDDEEFYEYYYQMKDEHAVILNELEEQLNDKDSEYALQQQALIKRADEIIAEHEREIVQLSLKEETERLQKSKRELSRMRSLLLEANRSKKVFCCFICSKAFLDEESCRQHVSNEHLKNNKEYAFKCRFCYMRFKRGHHLRRHEQTHIRSKNGYFSCNKCKSVFKEESSLAIHKSSVHSVGLDDNAIEKIFDCKICHKTFGLESEYKRHSYYCLNREHILEKRKLTKERICAGSPQVSPAVSVCSSLISSVSGRPVKDKSCPYCLEVFASMQSRNRHIKRKHPEHDGKEQLNIHMYTKVDTPELPFLCVDCQKRFSTPASLSIHKRRIHEKVLNHGCEFCDKKYPLASELKKHVKRVHPQHVDNFDIF